jgi:hypothetical protein
MFESTWHNLPIQILILEFYLQKISKICMRLEHLLIDTEKIIKLRCCYLKFSILSFSTNKFSKHFSTKAHRRKYGIILPFRFSKIF